MLRIIIADDSSVCRELLSSFCRSMGDVEIAGCFDGSSGVLECMALQSVHAVFLDVEMLPVNGLELGKEIRRRYPDTVIIYVAGKEEYCLDAMKMKADYFIFKPFSKQDIEDAIARAEKLYPKKKGGKLRIRTFGGFDVFRENTLIPFSNAKAKELLAICIDHRGQAVSMDEAIELLWPEHPFDDKVKRSYRKAAAALRHTLEQYDPEFFHTARGQCYIDAERAECDYFTYLKEGRKDWNCLPAYMEPYSWAEETRGRMYFLSISGEEEAGGNL